ncbi:protein kinase domain-containing protein [Oribacterium sp. FC2011]|uniref:protein kinase domain-containing protein n=1 Tax=Oribacterium sp. FC2011 TaxID=1408311 RepID=UPI0004E1AD0B|nr:protein kinase [Oribacterium sp. FC2011]
MLERKALDIGTLIRFNSGRIYKVTGDPIGYGGGGIIYPVIEMIEQNSEYVSKEFQYALKECFPYSPLIIRSDSGEIICNTEDDKAIEYLESAKKNLLSENSKSAAIYKTSSRIVPSIDASMRVDICFSDGEWHRINNCMTVMESLDNKGYSLATYLEEYRRIDLFKALHITQQILFALREIHEASYLHLDIQAGNIIIQGSIDDGSDLINIIDFGSSLKLDENEKTVSVDKEHIFSTPGFRAPELFLTEGNIIKLTQATDLYSVGCLLLYMLTGNVYDQTELLSVNDGKYLTVRKLRLIKCPKHLQDQLQYIIARFLEKEPDKRYQKADEALKDVTALKEAVVPRNAGLKAVYYDAFICYKHNEIDSAAAKKLQEELEHFVASKDVSKDRRPFKRVFIDDGELSAGSLEENIDYALKNSKYLIVVCSKETPKSIWVNKEIDTFLETHDRSHILPVLIDGEPEESFPVKIQKYHDKNTGIEYDELYAPNAKGDSLNSILKIIKKDTVYRIAAPMLNTTYDTLKNRQQRYIQKLVIKASLLVICTLSLFLFYAFKQNTEIKNERRQSAIHNDQYLSKLAQEQYEAGEIDKAIETALEALDKDGIEKPDNALALNVLSKSLNLYQQNEENYQVTKKYSEEDYIYDFIIDNKNEYLFMNTNSGIDIWNSKSGEKVNTVPSSPNSNIVQYDDEHIIFNEINKICFYNFKTSKYDWTYEAFSLSDVINNSPLASFLKYTINLNHNSVVCFTANEVVELDIETGKKINSIQYKTDGVYIYGNDIAISPEGSKVAVNLIFQNQVPDYAAFSNQTDYDKYYSENVNTSILVVDLNDSNYDVKNPQIGVLSHIRLLDQNTVILSKPDGSSTTAVFSNHEVNVSSTDKSYEVYGYNLDLNQVLWNSSFSYAQLSDDQQLLTVRYDNNLLLLSFGNEIRLLNYGTGEIINQWIMTDNVISMDPTGTPNRLIVFTSDGKQQTISLYEKNVHSDKSLPEGIKKIRYNNDVFYVIQNDNNKVVRRIENCFDKMITPIKMEDIDNTYSPELSNGLIIQESYKNNGKIKLYELFNEKQYTIEAPNGYIYYPYIKHSDENAYLFSLNKSNGSIFKFNLRNGEKSNIVIDSETSKPMEQVVNVNGKYIFSITHYKNNKYIYEFYMWDPDLEKIMMISSLETDIDWENYKDVSFAVDNNGENMLIISRDVTKNKEQDSYDLYLLNVNTSKMDHILNLDEKIILNKSFKWNEKGTMFSVLKEGTIDIYLNDGQKKQSIEVKDIYEKLVDLEFSYDDHLLMALTTDKILYRFDIETGENLGTYDLSEYLTQSIWENSDCEWTHIDDSNTVLKIGSDVIILNVLDSDYGVIGNIKHCNGYDKTNDVFIVNNINNELGKFKRYSIDDIIEKAKERINK